MSLTTVDRYNLLRNLRKSRLLSKHKFRLVVEKLGHIESPREIAKALASWKLLTKFQARMLLFGRKSGFHIGPYRILDELGNGGMGRVYKAVHTTMNRVVALKILAPRMTDTEQAKVLFRREIQAAARLNHPNIAMAFDAAEAKGRHYLAMEFVDGPNLEQYVTKHGPLPIGMASEIIFQTANGLQHAHEEGVVHRDIKPANLMLQQERGTGLAQIKILDFGLAGLRTHGDKVVHTGSSKEMRVMGTPDFLAPEQSKNLHGADIRSDLYSLGCTFYFLLTGQVPFPGGDLLAKLSRHGCTKPKRVEEVRPEVPRRLAKILRKMMAKDPADRFQTPGELMDAIAPHAVPTVVQGLAAESMDTSSKAPTVIHVSPDDTDPQAPAATRNAEADSFLEIVNMQYRERHKVRRSALSA